MNRKAMKQAMRKMAMQATRTMGRTRTRTMRMRRALSNVSAMRMNHLTINFLRKTRKMGFSRKKMMRTRSTTSTRRTTRTTKMTRTRRSMGRIRTKRMTSATGVIGMTRNCSRNVTHYCDTYYIHCRSS